MKQRRSRAAKRPSKMDSASPRKVDLDQLFEGIAREMRAKFQTIRENIDHGPSKGRGAEHVWREWLSEYLPRRYEVGTGFVTDSRGQQSSQQDIVIFDRHFSPILYAASEVRFIPVESVYAVIEVKTALTKEELDDAAATIGSVRALHRLRSQRVHHAGGEFRARKRGHLFGYIAASKGSWAKSTVWRQVHDSLPVTTRRFIDGGCLLDTGTFAATLRAKRVVFQHSSVASQALFSLLGLIFEDLKRLATVPPWDLAQYAASTGELRRPKGPRPRVM